jgi:hypothetical protein
MAGGHDVNHMYSRDLQIRMRRPLMGKDGPWGPGNSNSPHNLSCRWERRGGRAPAFCMHLGCVSEDACPQGFKAMHGHDEKHMHLRYTFKTRDDTVAEVLKVCFPTYPMQCHQDSKLIPCRSVKVPFTE